MHLSLFIRFTVEPVLRGHSKEDQKLVLRPDNQSLRPLFFPIFEWPPKTGFTLFTSHNLSLKNLATKLVVLYF